MQKRTLLFLATTLALAAPLPALAEKDPSRCAQLRRQLEIIDAQARKRASAQLDERRAVIVEEMTALRCSESASQ